MFVVVPGTISWTGLLVVVGWNDCMKNIFYLADLVLILNVLPK